MVTTNGTLTTKPCTQVWQIGKVDQQNCLEQILTTETKSYSRDLSEWLTVTDWFQVTIYGNRDFFRSSMKNI